MKHKPYPKYKDSGVEWLGEVPEHWEVWKIGHLTTKIGSGKTPTGGAEVYQSEGVLFIRSQNVYDEGLRLGDVVFIDSVTDEEMAWARVQANDILLNITGASLGRTCIVPQDMPPANVNQHVCIIRMRNREYADYVSWYLKSNVAKSFYDIAQTGSAREGLNFEQISSIQTLLPSLPEQQSIAGYLDRKTAKIDALIDKKQELVKRLREKRSALISHAVTKGINPKVKMKPSGVAWLGEVPEHWEVGRLRHAISSIRNGTAAVQIDEDADALPVSRIETISKGVIDYGKIGYVEPFKKQQDFLLNKGDLLLSHINSLSMIGNCAIYNGEQVLYSGMNLLRIVPMNRTDSKWLWYQIISEGFRKTLSSYAKPAINQASITTSQLRDMLIVIPPLSEQQTIAIFLDQETGKLDALITTVEEAIKKLKEYRSALISAAVTGKIDVRESK